MSAMRITQLTRIGIARFHPRFALPIQHQHLRPPAGEVIGSGYTDDARPQHNNLHGLLRVFSMPLSR